jgi:hypothetical protein
MDPTDTELTELTEFSELNADELHLVKRGANGFPTLLAKSVGEIDAYAQRLARADPNWDLAEYRRRVQKQEHAAKPKTKSLPKYVRQQVEARRKYLSGAHQESVMPKKSKAEKVAAKSLRKSMGQIRVRRNQEAVVKSAQNATQANIDRLEKALAKSPGQDGWQFAYQLHRARADMAAVTAFKAAMPDMNDHGAVTNYMADPNYPARAEAAASRAGPRPGQSTGSKAPP